MCISWSCLFTVCLCVFYLVLISGAPLPYIRPPPSQRKFNSTAIESVITSISSRMVDLDLATLFTNCLPCALDTTVALFVPSSPTSPPDSYIITGDINAQWLRDSTNQVLPYIPYITQDDKLRQLICGLIRRQTTYVLHDPYANAFNEEPNGNGHQDDQRHPSMTKLVFEGKYELDSLAAAMKLAWHYYNATQDTSCFTQGGEWAQAIQTILNTITAEQASTVPADESPYWFQRTTSAPTDSLMLGGVGNVGKRTGMSKSMFRPSDDATLFPFFVPANAMAVVELRHMDQMMREIAKESETPELYNTLARSTTQQARCHFSVGSVVSHRLSCLLLSCCLCVSLTIRNASSLADELDAAIRAFGIVPIPSFALPKSKAGPSVAVSPQMFAYEVDGFGGQNLMDDANIPSLLSLPYLGYISSTDALYLNTRAFLLSSNQPYFFQGSAASGIGSPHTGLNMVWPMALVTQAITSNNDTEILELLEIIKLSSAGTGWLHESFDMNDVSSYTRPWFSWVNSLFGQLIINLAQQKPYLIFKQQNDSPSIQRSS